MQFYAIKIYGIISQQWTYDNVGNYETVNITENGSTVSAKVIPFNISMGHSYLAGYGIGSYCYTNKLYGTGECIVTRYFYLDSTTAPYPYSTHIALQVKNISGNSVNAGNQYLTILLLGW